jgi:hypothetical protein
MDNVLEERKETYNQRCMPKDGNNDNGDLGQA